MKLEDIQNMNHAATMLCQLEGKKSQINRAQAKEVLKCVALMVKNSKVLELLLKYANKQK